MISTYFTEVTNKIINELRPQVGKFLLKFHNVSIPNSQLQKGHEFLRDQLLQYASKAEKEMDSDHLLLYEAQQIISQQIPTYHFDQDLIKGIKNILSEPQNNPLKNPNIKNRDFYNRIRNLINNHYAKANEEDLLQSPNMYEQEIEAEGVKLGKLKINFNKARPEVELTLYRKVILAGQETRKDISYTGAINPKTLENYLTAPQHYPNPLDVIEFDYPQPIINDITHQLLNFKPEVEVNVIPRDSFTPEIVVSDQTPTPASFRHEPKLIELLTDNLATKMIFDNKIGENYFTPEELKVLNAKVEGNVIHFTYSKPGEYRGVGISNLGNDQVPHELTWYSNSPSVTKTEEEKRARAIAVSACDKLEKLLGPLVVHTPFNRKNDIFYRTSQVAIHSNIGGKYCQSIKLKFEWLPNGTVKLYGKGYFHGGGEIEYKEYTHSPLVVGFFSFYSTRLSSGLLPTVYNLPPLREQTVRPPIGTTARDLLRKSTASSTITRDE